MQHELQPCTVEAVTGCLANALRCLGTVQIGQKIPAWRVGFKFIADRAVMLNEDGRDGLQVTGVSISRLILAMTLAL